MSLFSIISLLLREKRNRSETYEHMIVCVVSVHQIRTLWNLYTEPIASLGIWSFRIVFLLRFHICYGFNSQLSEWSRTAVFSPSRPVLIVWGLSFISTHSYTCDHTRGLLVNIITKHFRVFSVCLIIPWLRSRTNLTFRGVKNSYFF